MSDFPKWLLALAGISLLPVVLSPFYMFGTAPFGSSENGFIRFLLYAATQLLWLLPLLLFFFSLDFYRRGFERIGIGLCAFSALLSLFGVYLVLG